TRKRAAVTARLEGRAAGPAAHPAPPAADELLTLLRARLELPDGQAIEETHRLTADLGLDSLGRLDLLSALEERLGAELPESAIDDRTTVADLRARIPDAPAAAPPSFPRWAPPPTFSAARRL